MRKPEHFRPINKHDAPLMDRGQRPASREVELGLGLGTNFVSLARNNAKPGRPLPASFYGDPTPGRSALDKRKPVVNEQA